MRYKQFEFTCPSCNLTQKHFAWDNEIHAKCDNEECQQVLSKEDIISTKIIPVPGLRTPTKNRV